MERKDAHDQKMPIELHHKYILVVCISKQTLTGNTIPMPYAL